MKAVVCREPNGFEQLRMDDVEPPPLRDGAVRIRMRLAAINTPDLLMARGAYQVRPALPCVLGVEGMGVLTDVGAGVEGLEPGMRVMTYAGIGCFAEETVVPAHLVVPVPEGMPDEVAAGFILAYGTSWHGLVCRGGLAKGETLVVLGAAGGLGSSAVQIGKGLGARVIAVAGSRAKLDACLANGADAGIDSGLEPVRDRIRELTDGKGADVVYDVVGGDLTEAALRGIAPHGRLLIAGYASGTIPSIKANLILLKQASVIGVSFRQHFQQRFREAAEDMRALCRLWGSGVLSAPGMEIHPFDDVVTAMRVLAERRAMGKVLLRIR